MKLLILQQAEQQTLRDMGVLHPHPRVRIRAQAIVRLNQGLTLQQTGNEFHVHLGTESHRDPVETGQVLLVPFRRAERKRVADRSGIADGRFRHCFHNKFRLTA